MAAMDIAYALPVEIVEEIFTYLPCEDLISCSYVSLRWREIVNSNRIWSCLCLRENLHRKEFLDVTKSLFNNPTKRFKPTENTCERLTSVCHWRTHYDRYKFLQKNWRNGNCSLHHSPAESYRLFYNEGIIVTQKSGKLIVHCVSSRLKHLCEHRLAHPDEIIEEVIISKSHIIYVQPHKQRKTVVVLKRVENKFEKDFEIFLKSHSYNISITRPPPSTTIIKAENYLIIACCCDLHKILVYNIQTGEQAFVLDLEQAFGQKGLKVTCIKEHLMKLYVGFSTDNDHYISSYDLIENKWGINLNVLYKVLNIYVSKNFLCLKLKQWEPDIRSDLYILSLPYMCDVDFFTVDSYHPVILTDDDFIIYSGHSYVAAKALNCADKLFKIITPSVYKFFLSWNNLLVIDTGDSIEVWDLFKGEKLYTPFRGDNLGDIFVDDRMIINLNGRYTKSLDILGFW